MDEKENYLAKQKLLYYFCYRIVKESNIAPELQDRLQEYESLVPENIPQEQREKLDQCIEILTELVDRMLDCSDTMELIKTLNIIQAMNAGVVFYKPKVRHEN